MKIFIFEPYNWDYCGGALVVIADSYEGAIELLMQIKNPYNNEPEFGEHTFYKTEVKDLKERSYQWILSVEFELKGEHKPKVIINNWNYA